MRAFFFAVSLFCSHICVLSVRTVILWRIFFCSDGLCSMQLDSAAFISFPFGQRSHFFKPHTSCVPIAKHALLNIHHIALMKLISCEREKTRCFLANVSEFAHEHHTHTKHNQNVQNGKKQQKTKTKSKRNMDFSFYTEIYLSYTTIFEGIE